MDIFLLEGRRNERFKWQTVGFRSSKDTAIEYAKALINGEPGFGAGLINQVRVCEVSYQAGADIRGEYPVVYELSIARAEPLESAETWDGGIGPGGGQ